MKYLLDTNVIGEPLKSAPNRRVMAWLDTVHDDEVALSTPVLGEVLFGIQNLAAGRRRDRLMTQLRHLCGRLPVLDYDLRAAGFFALIMAERRAKGRPMQKVDAMIAGIARANNLTLVSCDGRAFAGGDVAWVNPLDVGE